MLFLALDLLIRNKELIIEKLDWLGEKFDKVVDPLANYPKDVVNYIYELRETGYSGRIQPTKIIPKYNHVLKDEHYEFKPYAPWGYMVIYLGLVVYTFFSEENIRYILYIAIIFFINFILFLLNMATNKVILVLDKEGIVDRDNNLTEWSKIEYTFLHDHSLIIKLNGKKVPTTINLSGISISSKKLGHLIETFKEKYKA